CRGEVNGTVVVDAARSFMNTKSRSCASETWHSLRRSSLSGGSPARAEVTVRRRSTARLVGEIYDGESRDDDNESSDGVESGPGPHSESSSQSTFSLFNGDVEEFLEIDKKEENRLKECY
nr:hypothetical protein [Tanacetum cinerariifolium]